MFVQFAELIILHFISHAAQYLEWAIKTDESGSFYTL